MANNWRPSLFVTEKCTVDELKFIFEQSVKRVEQTSQEGDRLYSKSIAVVTICLSILSALIAYIASNFSLSLLTMLAGVTSALLIIVVCILKNSIMPARYLGSGSYPKDLLVQSFYTNLGDKTTEWYFLMNEIIMYQERLEINVEHNKQRNTRLKDSFNLLYSIVPLVIIASIIFYLFS